MEFIDLIINTLSAFLTAVLSAIIGMGGGITLLAVMMLSMELAIIVPIHGVVQLASNGARWILFWEHIQWSIIKKFAIGLIPFGFVGAYLVDRTNPTYLKIFIGLFILSAIYFPFKKFKMSTPSPKSFILAGGLSGTVAMIAGATGPMIAPFFLDKGLTKESIIATKATCQAMTHFHKILLFGFMLQFDFSQYWILITCMVLAVIVGTYVGKRILIRYVSESLFIWIYKTVLTMIGIKILFYDGLRILFF